MELKIPVVENLYELHGGFTNTYWPVTSDVGSSNTSTTRGLLPVTGICISWMNFSSWFSRYSCCVQIIQMNQEPRGSTIAPRECTKVIWFKQEQPLPQEKEERRKRRIEKKFLFWMKIFSSRFILFELILNNSFELILFISRETSSNMEYLSISTFTMLPNRRC